MTFEKGQRERILFGGSVTMCMSTWSRDVQQLYLRSESVWSCTDWWHHCWEKPARCSPQKEQDSEEVAASSENKKKLLSQCRKHWHSRRFGLRNFFLLITLTSGGTPPMKNTMFLGSMSNRESVLGASPFWMNFCSSVEPWLGIVR